MPERYRHRRHAHHDQVFWLHETGGEARDRHQHQHGDAARHHRKPRQCRGIVERGLLQLRQKLRSAVEHRAYRHHDEERRAELAHEKQPHVDDRIAARQLPRNQDEQRDGGDHGEGGDEARREPVVALALVEEDFQAPERQHHQDEAGPIHLEAAFQPLPALAFQNVRFNHQPLHERQRKNAEGHIDEEYPVPGKIVRQPPTDRRADRRRDDDCDAVERECLRALFRREGVGKDRLLARRHAAAAKPLEDAEQDQHVETGRQAAKQRRTCERGDAQHVIALAADDVGEPAADRDDDRVGDEIGGDDPGALVHPGGKAAGNVAQRDIGDRGVEHHHEGRYRDDDRDEPGIAPASGGAAFAAMG